MLKSKQELWIGVHFVTGRGEVFPWPGYETVLDIPSGDQVAAYCRQHKGGHDVHVVLIGHDKVAIQADLHAYYEAHKDGGCFTPSEGVRFMRLSEPVC